MAQEEPQPIRRLDKIAAIVLTKGKPFMQRWILGKAQVAASKRRSQAGSFQHQIRHSRCRTDLAAIRPQPMGCKTDGNEKTAHGRSSNSQKSIRCASIHLGLVPHISDSGALDHVRGRLPLIAAFAVAMQAPLAHLIVHAEVHRPAKALHPL
eukprot:scaffold268_cov236-Pinguiococcus_pyrenoidosus.AAC.8